MKTATEHGSPADRRPLATRSWPIFQKLAARLAASGVSPNSISVASMVFAALGALGFLLTSWSSSGLVMRGGWLLAIVGIQLRLIANLLDGMVAVEGGRASSTGPLYNEVPDRVSDILLLISAGYAFSSRPEAGWAATILALLVAYIRAIAASVGAGQLFLGPMAKPHRMALLTAVCAMAILLPTEWLKIWEVSGIKLGLLELALWVMVVGSMITVVRRLLAAAAHLKTQNRSSQ